MPAVDLGTHWSSLLNEQSAYRRVTVLGELLERPVILLDNKILNGVVGYQLIQVFKLAPTHADPLKETEKQPGKSRLAWVNRGWLPAGRLRSDLPQINTPPGQVTIQAHVYQSLGTPFVLDNSTLAQRVLSAESDQPIIAQQFDLREMSQDSEEVDYFPHLLRLEADSSAAYAIDWPAVNTRPEKHQAYAIQWFAMALALLVFYLIRSVEKNSIEREGSND